MSRQQTPEQIVASIQQTVPTLRRNATEAMHKAVDLAKAREAELAPGSIGEHINTTVRETLSGVTGTIRPRDAKAGFVDKGTGLYREHHSAITAKKAGPRQKMLKIALPGGQVIYRRSVKGQKPQRFVAHTRDAVEAEVVEILAAGATKTTEELF